MELGEKYIYEVYKEKGFKKAAEKNFISQASLSATVKKTENKLGFLVFDRSQSPIALTPEGKIYIEYLEDAAQNERILNQRIQSLKKSVKNSISAGGTSFFARKLFPLVCDAFHKKFPDTELKIDLGEMYFYRHLLDSLDTNKLDFVVGYVHDEKKHTAIHLQKERYIIAARKNLAGIAPLLPYAVTKDELLSKKDLSDKEITDISVFKNIEFIDMGSNNVLRSALSGFIEDLNYSSCYIYGTRKSDVYYELMLSGMGAVITTDFTAACFENSDDVVFFLPDIENKYRYADIIYKKADALSPTAEEFIKIAQKISDTSVLED